MPYQTIPGARGDDPQHFGHDDRLAVLMALHHMFGGSDVCAIMIRHERRLVEVAMDRRAAELGVPPEEPEEALDRRRRMKAEREEPQSRERKLDIAPPMLAEIDRPSISS
jgi:hypothetical protein